MSALGQKRSFGGELVGVHPKTSLQSYEWSLGNYSGFHEGGALVRPTALVPPFLRPFAARIGLDANGRA